MDTPPLDSSSGEGGDGRSWADDTRLLDKEALQLAATETTPVMQQRPEQQQQLTFRALLVGSFVGVLMCCSNMFFGLQSGWVTMGSLSSSVLGYGIFRSLSGFRFFANFTLLENVVLQTVAVGAATLPLAAGFVGIIPALGMLTTDENPDGPVTLSVMEMLVWAASVSLFGVFFAVPLRKGVILKEKLTFPSGTATAAMLRTLHNSEGNGNRPRPQTTVRHRFVRLDELEEDDGAPPRHQSVPRPSDPSVIPDDPTGPGGGGATALALTATPNTMAADWPRKWYFLKLSFAVSAFLTLCGHFFPVLDGGLPVFCWMGLAGVHQWGWVLKPSLSYVAQGAIMGPRTALSMLGGALMGYALLGPISRAKGWADGPISSSSTGAKGWITWLSLAIMLGDSLTSLSVLVFKTLCRRCRHRAQTATVGGGNGAHADATNDADADKDPAPPSQQVPMSWWLSGLILSSIACVATVSPLFGMPVYEPALAVVFACLVAVLAVRALGETDLNPVSGLGKLSQAVFATIAPHSVVSNLIAGAVAEAGAQQSGDMMQDLKCGHIVNASPRAQFFAQLVGSVISIFSTVAAFKLFEAVYEIPGPELEAPTAILWLDMARVVTGAGLELDHVFQFAVGAFVLAGALALMPKSIQPFLPSPVAFAVGMYISPKWTIPRVVGAVGQWWWYHKDRVAHDKYMIVIASGLVLGEGIVAVINAVLTAVPVDPLTCGGCVPGLCTGCSFSNTTATCG